MTKYPNEDELQGLIAESPALLPGIDEPVPVARELSCDFGSIDIVAVDLSGGITLCECKTAQNRELRRQVVGQIFAYAAALSGISFESFSHEFRRAAGFDLVGRAQELAEGSEDGEWDEEVFRQAVAQGLETGDFRLVLAVEAIPEELREIVRYINLHSVSGLEVLALELSYRKDRDVEILVPRTWGEETAKPTDQDTKLDRESFLAKLPEAAASLVPQFLDDAESSGGQLQWVTYGPRIRVRIGNSRRVAVSMDEEWLFVYIQDFDPGPTAQVVEHFESLEGGTITDDHAQLRWSESKPVIEEAWRGAMDFVRELQRSKDSG